MQPAMSQSGALRKLLQDSSLEMTGKDVEGLQQAAPLITPGSRVNITFLGNEDLQMRLAAARAVVAAGLTPFPHISARRLPSQAALAEFLAALQDVGASRDVFVIGGDPAVPEGPYSDALSIIRSGMLADYGVRSVGFGGYPEGHPDISGPSLWNALTDKAAAAEEQGLQAEVVTQFAFDAEPVLNWLALVREKGIQAPVRIGVPGPAGVRRLLGYARRFGVGTSAGIAKKYGLSLTNLMSTAGPERFIEALAAGYDPSRHGAVGLHFYTFGGLRATAAWITDHRGEN